MVFNPRGRPLLDHRQRFDSTQSEFAARTSAFSSLIATLEAHRDASKPGAGPILELRGVAWERLRVSGGVTARSAQGAPFIYVLPAVTCAPHIF